MNTLLKAKVFNNESEEDRAIKNFVSRSLVVGTFIVILIAIGIYFYSYKSSRIVEPQENLAKAVTAFKGTSHRISAEKIKNKTGQDINLNPKADSDFMLVSWQQLTSLPARDEQEDRTGRVFLVNKIENQVHGKSLPRGYAIAISRDSEGVRFWVYWARNKDDQKGAHRWYPFASYPLATRRWFMLALTYTDQRYLSLHIAVPRLGKSPKVDLLGAYDLINTEAPSTSVNLVFGDTQNRRTILGPFGVFKPFKLQKRLKDAIKGFAQSGDRLTPILNKDSEVIIWRSAKDEESE